MQEGLTFETPFVLEGETYQPRIVAHKGTHVLCLPEKVLDPSPSRKKPDCVHFGTCGACHLRHLDYAESVALKRRLLQEALMEVAGAEDAAAHITAVAAPHPLHYRNNARFYLHEGRLTQHRMLTHDPFTLQECHVVSPRTWKTAVSLLPKLPSTVTELEIHENRAGEQMVIVSGTPGKPLPIIEATSRYWYDTRARQLQHIGGAEGLIHRLEVGGHGLDFLMGPQSFFQVHTAMAELLYGVVAREVPEEGLVYDLYAGTGTMGIILAKLSPRRRVICVERSGEMVAMAQRNAGRNSVANVTCMQHDVRTLTIAEQPECLLVDPPRNGLAAPSLAHLLSLKAPKILYVSCNPETFVRDTRQMLGEYALTSVTLFDMTPFTSHMEVLGVFERRGLW